jgi:hypothetical protein
LTNNSVVTGLEADTSTFSSGARGTEESNVLGLEDVLSWINLWVNLNIFRFTSQRGVVDFHLVTLENDYIAWDILTSLDLDDVTWNNHLGINLLWLSVPDNECYWWDEVLELSHHFSGFGGLHVREDTSQEDDGTKHNTQVQVGLILLVLLDTETDEAKEASCPKKKGEETGQLMQEDNVPWSTFLLLKSVVTPLLVLGSGLSWIETVGFVCAESCTKLVRVDHVLIPSTNSFGT